MQEQELAGLSERVRSLEEQVRLLSINLDAPPRILFIEAASAD
jgi:hypothetical protein